jgi:hypothetical protein
LASSINPSTVGEHVVLTAKVSASGTTLDPTGTVTFYDNGAPIGHAPLTEKRETLHAALTTSSLSDGTHNITASYAGDSAFTQSSSPPLEQQVKANTSPTSETSPTSQSGPTTSPT